MKCSIPTIADEFLIIAASPEIGVEKRVFYSFGEVRRLGAIEQDAADGGVFTADPTYRALTEGRDIQLVCLSSILSEEPVEVVLGLTLSDGSAGSGLAILVPSATAVDQTPNLPPGIGADFTLLKAGVDVTDSLKVRTVTGLLSVSNGEVGNKFTVVACPDRDTYTEIPDITDVDLNMPTGKPIPVPRKYQGANWVKRGRSEPSKLMLKSNYIGADAGLPRINDQRVTIMVESWKEDRVLTERKIVGGYHSEVKVTKPDGNGIATASSDGIFESSGYCVFV